MSASENPFISDPAKVKVALQSVISDLVTTIP